MFRLVDDTGECVVDPDHAHVIPECDHSWYGDGPEYRSRPPKGRRLIALGLGRYRFRERLILPATAIYALGWFRTLYNNPSDELIAKQAEDLVRQWKLQPERYLSGFDRDDDGAIRGDEWKAIRMAARNEILNRMQRQKAEHHVISRPTDTRHPYIISTQSEEVMLGRKRLGAYASVGGAFALFSTLVIMFSIRPPMPV